MPYLGIRRITQDDNSCLIAAVNTKIAVPLVLRTCHF